MAQYAIKRILLLFVTLFGIMVITFVLTRMTPGDPATMKVAGSGGGGSRAVGGYDDLVEQNRRNLGLDKPWVFNLNFEDRTYRAERSLDDYLREMKMWQNIGEKNLQRATTVALKPALDRYPLIGTPDEPVARDSKGVVKTMLPPAEQKARIATVLPRLAGAADIEAPTEPDAAYEFWKAWYEENKERFDADRVAKAVADYLDAPADAEAEVLQRDVLRAGGFAVPHLMERLGTEDIKVLRRINTALESQTGFTFAASAEEFERDSGTLEARWRSWWRRERMAYAEPSGFEHGVNILRNTQFGLWVSQALFFDFGDSYMKKKPVVNMIAEALPISMALSFASILIGYLIAIPLGIFSAVKKNTPADKVITVILFVLYSLPSFWVAGLLLMSLTGPPFDLFPTRQLASEGITLEDSGFGRWLLDRLWHMVLPVTCLTYASLAFISRQMRSAMLETISQDYIRTAKAKGLDSRAVIFKHALRNSLIPILTISAGLLPELIAGAVIIESIFTIPGMGLLTFEAIVNRDYPVINAVLFFSAFLTLLGILLADLSYALVDPRISYS